MPDTHANGNNVPLVSIVIPTHNRRHLLGQAVRSCLDQQWPNIEVIIVDDGSTDGTADMVAAALATDWPNDRIRYICQENGGAPSARNHGLRLAQGDYIQFLDSDDLLHPTKIEKQIAVLSHPDHIRAAFCGCFGRVTNQSSEGDISYTVAGTRIGLAETEPKRLLKALSSRMVHGMQTSAPLWRKHFLAGQSGWMEDLSVGQDLEYHVRLVGNAEQICFVEEELFIVRHHTGSMWSASRITARFICSMIRARRSVFDVLKHAECWDRETQRAFLDAMRTIYANALTLGNAEIIRDLENWMWRLASAPVRRYDYLGLIIVRRIVGGSALLRLFRIAKAGGAV